MHHVLVPLSALPSRLEGPISTDLETWDPGLKTKGPGWCFKKPDGHIVGYGYWTPKASGYLPVGHVNGGNVDPVQAANWYQEVVAEAENDKIGANIGYDVGWCRTAPSARPLIKWEGQLHDVLVQAPLIDEHRFSYDLDNLAKEKVPGSAGKSKTLLEEEAHAIGIKPKDIMSNLHRFSPMAVGTYCVEDCKIAYETYEVQVPEIAAQGLGNIYQLEIDLIRMLVEMRSRGVRVDQDEGERVQRRLSRYEAKLLAKIRNVTGVHIDDPFSGAQLEKVFESIGVKVPRTPKTDKPSIDKDWLETLRVSHPIAKDVRRVRQVHVTNRDYVTRDILNLPTDGRLYGSFNPLKSDEGGTISGRFSASKPNLQQIPGRDKILGPMVRGLYLPEEGCLWGAFDYSQQEPRNMTAMAYRAKIQSSYQWRRKYIDEPTTDFHDMAASFTGLIRDDAKNLGLGIAYSMGSGKLARKLGLPTEWITLIDRKTGKPFQLEVAGPEGQAIMRQFNGAAGFIKELSKLCTRKAKERGWIVTPMGRRFHFPYRNGENFKSHKALNSLIQGMSADETKNAMRTMWFEGIVPALTVHDEIDRTDLTGPEDGRRTVEIMLGAMPKPVPSRVDFELGVSWGVAKKNKVDLPGLPVIYTEA